MEIETKICQNCKASFTIDAQDFAFYEKIKVPAPTWCPECRAIRRLIWRDNLLLYKRKSDFTNEEIFSIFSNSTPRKVYEREIWFSDKWDPLKYGKDYDFSKPFFQQFYGMLLEVPVPARSAYSLIGSDYSATSHNIKNCYLVFTATNCENCSYGSELNKTKDSIDTTRVESSQSCYESFALNRCYKVFFSANCEDCVEVWFSKNLAGCNNCFGCINLRKKQYYIFNQPYLKEEYYKKIESFNLSSFSGINELGSKIEKHFLKNIEKYYSGRHNTKVSGEYINNSKNVLNSYYVNEVEDGRYVQFLLTPSARDCYDHSYWGENTELTYECSTIGDHSSRIKFSYRCFTNCSDTEYSTHCNSSSYLFGCIGLRNKEYCILNKQYTKEEYEELVPKIIEQMDKMPYVDKKGRIYKYGEFFPPELSPFCYNETVAQEYFPLTKEQALAQGYSWKDPEERNISIDIRTEDLPDHIKDVKDDIVAKVIQCANAKFSESGTQKINQFSQCTSAFKIIPQELEFYRKMNLPLPRLCPNCRHYQRLKQRNPLKLWHRKCMCGGKQPDIYQGRASVSSSHTNTIEHFHGDKPCPNEFETSYAPDRPEIVYCEECYKREVN